MKGTAIAVIGFCLKLLALVDAISLAKVSVSRYNVGWEQVESDWSPDDRQANFLKRSPFFFDDLNDLPAKLAKENVQYNTPGTSTEDLPNSQIVDELSQHPNLASGYVDDIPSQNIMPPNNAVDYWQTNSDENDPFIKLKLKLNIKLPLAYRVRKPMVPEPNFENTEMDSTVDYPITRARNSINHVGEHIPEPVEDESEKKVEKSESSSTISHGVEETAANLDDVTFLKQSKPDQDDLVHEITKIDAYLEYLNKLQQLIDTLNKFQDNRLANTDDPKIESNEIIGQVSEHLPEHQIQNSDPSDLVSAHTDHHVDDAVLREPKISPKVFENSQTSRQLLKAMPKDHMKLSDPDDFESEPAKEDPHAKLYDDIHRASKIPEHTFQTSQTFDQLSKDESEDQVKLSDPDSVESESAEEDPHAKLYDDIYRASKIPEETSQTFGQLSKDESEDQMRLSDPDDFESEPAKEDPHAKLYDDIHRASKIPEHTFQTSQTFDQLSKDESEDQVKLSDPDSVESESAEEDPHAKLYDDIYRASKIPEETSQTFGQLSKDESEDQMRLSDPDDFESEPAKEDPHAKLYDDIHRASKIPEQTSQTFGQLSKDESEDQVKLSDPDYVESESAEEDPHAKLYDDIYRASKIPEETSQTFGQLSKDESEDQMRLSDPDDFESEPAKEDPHAKLYDDIHRASKIPEHTFQTSQTFDQLSKDESEDQVKLSDPDSVESESAEEDPHAKLYDDIYRASKIPEETSQTFGQLSKDESEDQMRLSDPDDFESEPAKEDPHAKLYDDIHRASKIPEQTSQTFGQLSKDESEDQVKLSDPDYVESESAEEDPHAKLYDDIYRASKIPEETSQTFGQLSKDESEDQMRLSDPDDFESEPAKEDPHAKLYDDIYRASKIPEQTSQTFGQLSKDESEDQVKLSDPDYVESESAEEDPHAKLYDDIYRASKIPEETSQTFGQLSKDEPEVQMKLSDPDDVANEPAEEDPHAKLYDDIYTASKILEQTSQTFGQLSKDKPEDQVKLQSDMSDTDDTDRERTQDPYVNLYSPYDDLPEVSQVFGNPRSSGEEYTGVRDGLDLESHESYQSGADFTALNEFLRERLKTDSTESTTEDVHEDIEPEPANGFLARLFSWLGKV